MILEHVLSCVVAHNWNIDMSSDSDQEAIKQFGNHPRMGGISVLVEHLTGLFSLAVAGQPRVDG